MRTLTKQTDYRDLDGNVFDDAKVVLHIEDDGSFYVDSYTYYDSDKQETLETYEEDGFDNDAIERYFNVKIEDNKIVEEPIVQQGAGQGSGEIIRVKARHLIESIIKDISPIEAFIKAKENQTFQVLDGHSYVGLQTGTFYGYGMAYNTSNHACDNNEIELYKVDQNDVFGFSIYDEDNLYYFVKDYLKEEESFKSIFEDDPNDELNISQKAEMAEGIDSDLFDSLRKDFEDCNRYACDISDFNQDVEEQLNDFYSDLTL